MAGDGASSGLTKTLDTRDGRQLAYLEVGNPNGPLVIHNHGGPSSRLEAVLFRDVAAKKGLRFVCIDRPGIGRSSRQRGRSYAGWADDMTALANALGHREFGVTGWSEGGPWALAAAAYIDSDRLRHVTSIAAGSYGAFGDNWAADQLSKIDAFGGSLAMRFKPGFHLMYATMGMVTKRARGTYLKQIRKSVNDYDRRVLAPPDVSNAFIDASAECFARGSSGLVEDSQLLYRKWAFDVTAIERPVHMWQGTSDTLVPPSINKTIADRMPGAVWHSVENGGHFIAVGAADEVLGITADELG